MEVAMFPQRHAGAALADIANLVLGLLLFFSPWIFGFVSELASENAWLSGAAISFVASAAILAVDAREERLNLLVGLWVAASPWLLGLRAEMHIHSIVGGLVAALALIELLIVRRASHENVTAGGWGARLS
jgi:SPW repeat